MLEDRLSSLPSYIESMADIIRNMTTVSWLSHSEECKNLRTVRGECNQNSAQLQIWHITKSEDMKLDGVLCKNFVCVCDSYQTPVTHPSLDIPSLLQYILRHISILFRECDSDSLRVVKVVPMNNKINYSQ